MRGLLLKDFLAMKKEMKTYLIIFILYSGFTIYTGQTNLMMIMGILFGMSIITVSMSYDERAKWDKYALGMKIDYKDIVLSKYVLGGICTIIMGGIMFASEIFLKKSGEEIMLNLGLVLIIGVGILSVIIPTYIKFGVERGRIISMIFIMIPGVIIFLFLDKIEALAEKAILFISNYGIIALGIALIGIVLISIWLSLKFYKSKEF